MINNKLLLIEDDELTSEIMSKYLIENNFIVDVVFTATDGISYINTNEYDLVLLDINLPDFNGFELLKSIKHNMSIPIIVISAFNDKQTKLQAFKYGVSDYMVKPIDLDELEARIWVHVSKNSKINILSNSDIFIIQKDNIYFKNTALTLTNIEFEVLSVLINNKNSIISRDTLTELLSCISTNRSLDNHIKNIRIKLNKIDKNNKYLQTKYGLGYILNINH